MRDKFVIFDLDDTLAYEIDFLKSAYMEIANKLAGDDFGELYELMVRKYGSGDNVFNDLENDYSIKKEILLDFYRNHYPTIGLIEGAKELLTICKERNFKLGLISDGRSVTQRNKLKALNIEHFFDKIIISEEFGTEKPNKKNFEVFIQSKATDYFYIADNPDKDFISPNKLGWSTICLLSSGTNIHYQNFELKESYLPKIKVNSLLEIIPVLT